MSKRITGEQAIKSICEVIHNLDDINDITKAYNTIVGPGRLVEAGMRQPSAWPCFVIEIEENTIEDEN